MTPQEIIEQVRRLPVPAQREIIKTLTEKVGETEPITEAEGAKLLLAMGTFKEIPAGWDKTDGEDFEPIEIEGKPLSEIILEDRN